MADSFRFEVKGLRELGRNLAALKQETAAKIAPQMTSAGARVVKAADKANISRASVDTGLLEKNVIIKKVGKRDIGNLTAAHIVTIKKVRYPQENKTGARTTTKAAAFLEFGTVKMQPEPHLAPALRDNIQKATEAMRAKGAAAIERAAKKGGA